LQFIQSAQEFLLPKLKQKYFLWFCCDGGIFHKTDEIVDNDSIASMYEDLNIQELSEDDPRINQVRRIFMVKLKSEIYSFTSK
jgi:hypothetical protein